MALLDSTLLFWHTGNVYNMTSGEFVTFANLLTTASSSSTVINLGNPRDLGIGPGQEMPTVDVVVGTAFTSSSAGLTLNLQFQGSTDSSTWTTYQETGANSTASWAAGYQYKFYVPHRLPGSALPQYYRLNLVGANASSTATITTGTLIAGIGLAIEANPVGLYASGFTVA